MSFWTVFLYNFQWTHGDFVIGDNLALIHTGSQEATLPPEEVGLRVIHYSSVVGSYKPKLKEQCMLED